MNLKAFTLVELIVVITILAVLGTLGFMSFQGYAKTARDSVRISDLTTISKALEFERTKNSTLPLPDDYIAITASGTILSYQGKTGSESMGQIGISEAIIDPLDSEAYIYSTNKNKTEYQLLGYLEGELSINNYSNKAFADKDSRNLIHKGKKLGIILKADTAEVLDKSIVGNSFDIYVADNNYKVIFGNKSDEQQIFTDNNRQELAYYNSRSCKAIYEFGAHDGDKIYTIYPSGISVETYCDMSNGGGEVRNFRTFDGVDDYVEIPEVTASGDFELELDFLIQDNDKHLTILSSSVLNDFFRITDMDTSLPTLAIRIDNHEARVPIDLTLDGKIHRLMVKRVGAEIDIYLDNVKEGTLTQTWTAGVVQIVNVGRLVNLGPTTGQLFDGIISNINFKSGWTQNGVVNANPYYRLDDGDDAAQNSNTILTDVNLPSNFLVAGSAYISGNIITGNNDNWAYIGKDVATVAGKTYVYSFQGTSSSNGDYYARVFDLVNTNYISLSIQNISGNKNQLSFTAESNISRIYIQQSNHLGTGDTLTQNYIDLEEAPGYGNYINFSDSSVEKFTEDIDGDWVGQNIWNDDNATVFGNATKLPIGAQISLNASEGAGFRILNILDVGQKYKVDLNIENYIDGNVAENSSNFNSIGVTGNGIYSHITPPVTYTQANLSRAGSSCHYDIAHVEWRKFLEMAE